MASSLPITSPGNRAKTCEGVQSTATAVSSRRKVAIGPLLRDRDADFSEAYRFLVILKVPFEERRRRLGE